MNSNSITGKQNKRGYQAFLAFLKTNIGQDEVPHRRYFGATLQLIGVFIFSITTFMWSYNLMTDSWFMYFLGLVWNMFSLLALAHFTYGFFLSVKFNLPRMISTKNTIGLFLFAVLFFETLILSVLFWILSLILWYTESVICGSEFCSGLLSGLFGFVNIIAGLCTLVIYLSRRNLGIGILDSFGIF